MSTRNRPPAVTPSQRRAARASPCFVSGPKGYFALETDFASERRCSLSAYESGYFEALKVFDGERRLWRVERVECARKRGGLNRLIAAVHNPTTTVSLHWAEPSCYGIDELRSEYARAVDLDDDSLTQFVERDELKRRIATAADFAALVAVYEWAGVDDEE